MKIVVQAGWARLTTWGARAASSACSGTSRGGAGLSAVVPGADDLKERLDDARVELGARRGADHRDRLLDRPRLLVRPLVRERVEHVGDRHDPPDQRDVVADQALRIAAPVPPLVVGLGDHARELQRRRAASEQQPRAERRVGLHQLLLVTVEPTRLQQHAIGDRELADVVQRGGFAQQRDALGGDAEALADLGRHLADPFGVLVGLVVAVLAGDRQQLQRLGAGLVEVTGALFDHRSEPPGLLRELRFGAALRGDVVRVAVDRAVGLRAAGAPLEPQVPLLTGLEAAAQRDAVAAAVGEREDRRRRRVAVVRMHEVAQRTPLERRRRVPEAALPGGVRALDATGPVGGPQQLERLLEVACQLVLGRAQRGAATAEHRALSAGGSRKGGHMTASTARFG